MATERTVHGSGSTLPVSGSTSPRGGRLVHLGKHRLAASHGPRGSGETPRCLRMSQRARVTGFQHTHVIGPSSISSPWSRSYTSTAWSTPPRPEPNRAREEAPDVRALTPSDQSRLRRTGLAGREVRLIRGGRCTFPRCDGNCPRGRRYLEMSRVEPSGSAFRWRDDCLRSRAELGSLLRSRGVRRLPPHSTTPNSCARGVSRCSSGHSSGIPRRRSEAWKSRRRSSFS